MDELLVVLEEDVLGVISTLDEDIVLLYGSYSSTVTTIAVGSPESITNIELLSERMSLFAGSTSIFKIPSLIEVGFNFSIEIVPVS